jgi:hypothetical protein
MHQSRLRPSHVSLDNEVRFQLSKWPQRPPGIAPNAKQPGTWLKARPGDATLGAHPFLKLPGSNTFRTLPDGMWLHFSTEATDPYVDILCIEACSSLQNLLDKRSRFAPSTSSLMAMCPLPWLLTPPLRHEKIPRWKLIRMLKTEPTDAVILPVRDVRVVFGLRSRHYDGFARSQVPHPHEFFCPMEALTAENGDSDPDMRALMSRASATSNFMRMP